MSLNFVRKAHRARLLNSSPFPPQSRMRSRRGKVSVHKFSFAFVALLSCFSVIVSVSTSTIIRSFVYYTGLKMGVLSFGWQLCNLVIGVLKNVYGFVSCLKWPFYRYWLSPWVMWVQFMWGSILCCIEARSHGCNYLNRWPFLQNE